MGKSVVTQYVPYVPCSKMKPCDLGSISKSLEEAMVKLQTLRRGHEGDVNAKKATGIVGVPRGRKQPDLCLEEVNKLRENIKAYSTQDSSFAIHKLKSSLGDFQKRNKEEGERKSRERKESLKSETEKEADVCLASLESKSKDVQKDDVGDVLTSPKEEESAHLNSTQVLVEEKEQEAKMGVCSSIYLSPLELSINKKLQHPLSLKRDNFLSLFEGQKSWDSSKGEARGGTCLFSCSKVQIQTYCISCYPRFKPYFLGGLNLHSLILRVELVDAAPMVLRQATMLFDPGGANDKLFKEQYEFGNMGAPQIIYVIFIYDPGGGHKDSSLEVVFKLERA